LHAMKTYLTPALLAVIAALLGVILYKMPASTPTGGELLKAAHAGPDAYYEALSRTPSVFVTMQ
jgi:hypothetical protein